MNNLAQQAQALAGSAQGQAALKAVGIGGSTPAAEGAAPAAASAPAGGNAALIAKAEAFAGSAAGKEALSAVGLGGLSGMAALGSLASAAQATGGGTASAGQAGLMGKAMNFANSDAGKAAIRSFGGATPAAPAAPATGGAELVAEAEKFAGTPEGNMAMGMVEKEL